MRGTGVSTVGLCHDALEVSSDGRFFPLSNLLFKSGAQQVRLSKPCKSPHASVGRGCVPQGSDRWVRVRWGKPPQMCGTAWGEVYHLGGVTCHPNPAWARRPGSGGGVGGGGGGVPPPPRAAGRAAGAGGGGVGHRLRTAGACGLRATRPNGKHGHFMGGGGYATTPLHASPLSAPKSFFFCTVPWWMAGWLGG